MARQLDPTRQLDPFGEDRPKLVARCSDFGLDVLMWIERNRRVCIIVAIVVFVVVAALIGGSGNSELEAGG
ncbi:MAG: hypothetical protein ACLQBB_16320 [Solirubrobacteraceae bacterium]